LARELMYQIPESRDGLFNPWKTFCDLDTPENGPCSRFARLVRHLDCDAKLILVGEAPGYQGCRYSGVAFTSERLLCEGVIPRMAPTPRLSMRKLPFSEPSATIVWKTLYRLGMAEDTILWNALQMHPFQEHNVWSNRTPSDEEIALGERAMRLLQASFPKARIIAVGRKAEGLLHEMGVRTAGQVRHPANGGAVEFAQGLEALRS
jgi:hypothetical protein